MNKNILTIGIIFLFIVSALTPIVLGYNRTTDESPMVVSNSFDRYLYPEYYDCYNVDEIPSFVEQPIMDEYSDYKSGISQDIVTSDEPINLLDGPMNSAWPMHGHDIRHTGRSPFSTADTWDEIWTLETSGWADSPTIDKDGIIYIGAYYLYAVYPNGTLKWTYYSDHIPGSAPTIDENGVIYFGTIYGDDRLYAINPDGTKRWSYYAGGDIFSAPAIDADGIIYFGSGGGPPSGNINAVYPNGTLKWKYGTNHAIYSSPALGDDGTVYCGSHDTYVYALNPNGTLKWKFKTGDWVHGSPTIANDGTVYIGSDDGFLYALNPNNGSLEWKIDIGSVYASPAIDEDGTIYVGVWQKKFFAINPDGTIKWTFNTGDGEIWGCSPALSDDDTLYFTTCDLELTGGIEIIALYTDGTVKWRKALDSVFSSPAIAEDGSVYIGSNGPPGEGFLNAFGVVDLEAVANGPYFGLINEPVQFKGTARGGYSPHSYRWDFGDSNTSNLQNPEHIFTNTGEYAVTLTVTDNTGNTSEDTTYAWIQESNNPPILSEITGTVNGHYHETYPYYFTGTDPEGAVLWYFVDWGDNRNTGWFGPYPSGIEVSKDHYWYAGTFTIRCQAKDGYGAKSEWSELTVTMPKDKATNLFFLQYLDNFPLLQKILLSLIK